MPGLPGFGGGFMPGLPGFGGGFMPGLPGFGGGFIPGFGGGLPPGFGAGFVAGLPFAGAILLFCGGACAKVWVGSIILANARINSEAVKRR
jgi:hypothetical protein